MTPTKLSSDKLIITLDYGGNYDPDVASCCDCKGHYWIFDPNSGFLDFGAGDKAWDSMNDWYFDELPRATLNRCGKIEKVYAKIFNPAPIKDK